MNIHILHWAGIIFGVAMICVATRPATPVKRKTRTWVDCE